MRLVTSPVALPGCCFICRGAQRESYIDTDVSIDMYGAYYICNMCLMEMAHMCSYISHDEYKDLRRSKDDLEHINYELIKRVGALEESLHALANAGYKYTPDNGVVSVGGYSATPPEILPGITLGSAGDMEPREGESSESDDDEDLARLRPGGDLTDFEFILDI